jgi:putative SOS response-associated peptidase YedK
LAGALGRVVADHIAAPVYGRWLSEEPDAHELMKSFPAEAIRMWPVSTRVNKPENDDPEVMKELALDMA